MWASLIHPRYRLFNQHQSAKSGLTSRLKDRGQVIVESVFGIIITVIIFLLIAAISIFMFFQTAVFMSARQGARVAAITPGMSDGSAVSTVRSEVQSFFNNMTGQTVSSGNITVTGPTGATGYRNVSVRVTYTLDSPIPLGAFLESLGAAGAQAALDSFDCDATATMRYEE
jgi:flagellar basal body-associated protein FliL